MGRESSTLAGVQHHHLVVTIVSEHTGPSLLHCAVKPHELVFTAPFDFPIVFGIERLELVFEGLRGRLGGDQDDAKSALSGQTNISGTLVVQLRD